MDHFLKSIFKNPDLTIRREDGSKYLERWWLIPKNKYLNLYLHHFHNSDPEVLHDHPWASVGMLLAGSYREHVSVYSKYRQATKHVVRTPFWPVYRSPDCVHRIELFGMLGRVFPVWSLFMTFPKVQEWGFWCKQGKVHNKEFLNKEGTATGAGCGEEE